MSKYHRTITAAEQHLWRYTTRNVRPYNSSGQKAVAPEPSAPRPSAVACRSKSSGKNVAGIIPHKLNPITVGTTPNIDRRTSTKLKRGQLSLDARSDLHGLTLQQAHARLTAFLTSAYSRGARCVLVVTGKGRTGEQPGKIRRELPYWINNSTLRSLVLAVTEARIGDGGSGAFYILLKRKRPGTDR